MQSVILHGTLEKDPSPRQNLDCEPIQDRRVHLGCNEKNEVVAAAER